MKMNQIKFIRTKRQFIQRFGRQAMATLCTQVRRNIVDPKWDLSTEEIAFWKEIVHVEEELAG